MSRKDEPQENYLPMWPVASLYCLLEATFVRLNDAARAGNSRFQIHITVCRMNITS